MRRYSLSLLLWLFLVPLLQAQLPKYSNEFLSVGVGARALAMSGAVVASVKDGTSGYWNPSGLLQMEKRYEAGLMHAEYFAGIAGFDYAGFGTQIDEQSSLGLSLIRFGVDDIPNTLELIDQNGNIRYDRVKTFSAADYAFLLSYARRVKGLSLGGNLKVIYRHTGDFASAWGFGIDASLQYRKGSWILGAIARDVTTTFNVWSFNRDLLEETFLLTGNTLPENSLELTAPRLITAIAREWALSPKFSLLTELDADFTFDGRRQTLVRTGVFSIDPHLGMELGFKGLAFFRLGAGNIQRMAGFDGKESLSFQPNLGLGIIFKGFCVDYALTDIGDQSVALYSNIFSVSYMFGDKYKPTEQGNQY